MNLKERLDLNIQFRSLSLKNIDECTELYIKVFNGEPWNDNWQEGDAKERLTDIFSNHKFLGVGVYDEKNNIIGFFAGYTERWLKSNHFNLNEICIKTALQNKGIGSKLLDRLEIKCKQNNISRIYLLTERAGQAEAFYKKNSFYVSPKMIMMAKRLKD